MRRAFNPIGRGAVGRNVESLIRVVGTVEVVGPKDLVFGVEVIVDAAKDRRVPHRVVDRPALVITEIGLKEIQKRLTLAISTGRNLSIGNRSTRSKNRAADAARGSQRRAQILAIEILHDSFGGREEE